MIFPLLHIYVVIVFGIPLHELAIYPLARNWLPSTLKRVGITAFGTIIVAFVALSVDMIVHAHTKATVVCMFAVNSVSGSVLSITYVWIGVILGVVTEIEFVIIFAALFDVCRHHTA